MKIKLYLIQELLNETGHPENCIGELFIYTTAEERDAKFKTLVENEYRYYYTKEKEINYDLKFESVSFQNPFVGSFQGNRTNGIVKPSLNYQYFYTTGIPPNLEDAIIQHKKFPGSLGTIGYFYDENGQLRNAGEITGYIK